MESTRFKEEIEADARVSEWTIVDSEEVVRRCKV